MMPVVGEISPSNYCSRFDQKETARPGYYQVYLDRYNVNVELTSNVAVVLIISILFVKRCKVCIRWIFVVQITLLQNGISKNQGIRVFAGYQAGEGKIFFL